MKSILLLPLQLRYKRSQHYFPNAHQVRVAESILAASYEGVFAKCHCIREIRLCSIQIWCPENTLFELLIFPSIRILGLFGSSGDLRRPVILEICRQWSAYGSFDTRRVNSILIYSKIPMQVLGLQPPAHPQLDLQASTPRQCAPHLLRNYITRGRRTMLKH